MTALPQLLGGELGAVLLDSPALRPAAALQPGSTPIARVVGVALAAAETVDRSGAFPAEALESLRRERLLSGMLPRSIGGGGLTIAAVAAQCHALGGACGSTAMVFAMHQTQLACLLAHGGSDPWQARLLARVADEQMLIASATSETGVGGDFRTSRCALEWADNQFTVEKTTPIISYGAHADCILVTARRTADASGADQVLVAVPADGYTLERRGTWDGMGLRGTDSCGFRLTAAGSAAQVLPDAFSIIASRTMLPLSHLLWSALWLGTAADVITRTKRFLKQEFRRTHVLPAGAHRLVDAVSIFLPLRSRCTELLARYERQFTEQSFGALLSDTAEINMLKVAVSEGSLAVARTCLVACGFQGYGNAGPFSLSRQLRDLEAGPLMVNNDRIDDNTAHMLLAQLPDLTLGIHEN